MADELITVRMRLRGAREYARGLRDAATDTRRFSDESERAGRGVNILQRVIGLVKPAALIASVGLLTQVMSAGAAGAVALTSGLAPMVGVLGVLPGLAVGGAAGLGVLRFAMAGVGGALGGLNEQIDQNKLATLTPQAQAFVRVLDSMKPRLRGLQEHLQARLFPGLTDGAHAAAPALNALAGPLGLIARAMGDVGRRVGVLVGSRGFLTDMRSQLAFTADVIPVAATAGIQFANTLRDIMVEARPLTHWLLLMVAGWIASTRATTRAGRESGRLAGFFERTRMVLSRVFSIVGALGLGLWRIVTLGRPLGDDLLASLNRNAEAFARWTGSARGRNSIVEFFRNARQPIYETAGLIKDLAGAFLRIGNQPGVGNLIARLRTLVPVLERVVSGTTAAFGPAMISAVIAFAQAFEPLAGASGPLVMWVKLLTELAKGLLWLQQTIPGFSQALALAVGVFGVYKVTVGLAAIATRAWTMAATAAAVATRVFALALLWLATANPITLIVIAIVAFIAILVVAYAKVGWFRRAVNTAFDWIKQNWPLLLAILTGPIGLAVLLIVRNFNRIVGFVRSLPSRLAAAGAGMWDWIKTAFKNAINWVLGKWNGIHLTLPKVDLGPLGEIGGGRIGLPQVPLLAAGGIVSGRGSWITGDAGAELNTMLPGGRVMVRPLTGPALAPPTLATPVAAGGPAARPIVIHATHHINVDGRELARSTSRHVSTTRGEL